MLGYWRSHHDYQLWLKSKLISLIPQHAAEIHFYGSLVEKLYVLNLDPLKEIIAPLYSLNGRPAHNQPELFRALVAMLHCKTQDPTKLVAILRASPVLAAICGFDEKTPGVGTLYGFLARLWLFKAPQKAIKKPRYKDTDQPKANEKLKPKHPDIVKKLVDKALQGRVIKKIPERVLQTILKECAVIPSAKLGLLGDTDNLTVAGDGSPIRTGANPRGKKLCQCRAQGIYHCQCERSFTDPTANWGWDSYHRQWFYGHTLYSITSADSFNDLPIYLRLLPASRHDSVSFVFSWAEMLDLYPEFKFSRALLDSAHDVYAIYRLLDANHTAAFIDLNSRRKNRTYAGPLTINVNGVPVCIANLPMLNWGFNNDRCRIKWRCPLYKDNSKCSKLSECSPSKYGRVVYTKPAWDLRLFTPVPRGSKTWKAIYARRSSVERTFKRLLVDYKIEDARCRTKKRWFWQATLAAVNQHLDAQVSILKPSILSDIGIKVKPKVA